MDCKQELCIYWSGDGNVCPCALLDLDEEVADSFEDDDLQLPWTY